MKGGLRMPHDVYPIGNDVSDSLLYKILYITHSEYDKGWHSTPHLHHFTELFYIVSGVGSFILPDQEIPVKKNDLVVINPNIEHTERSNTDDSLEYIALGIEGLVFSLPDAKELPIGLFTYQGDRKEILFFLNKLLAEVQQQDQGYELICHNIIDILIIKLRRAKQVTVEVKGSKSLNQSVALVKHYINHNFESDITLNFLAKIGNISKYYLAHRFKEDVGLSPIEYLNEVRIKAAKTLLETTDFTIAIISEASGFSSQSLFSQTFRRFENQTPSEYRKTNRARTKRISTQH